MPETTTGLRAVLSSPKVYDFAMFVLGSKRLRTMLANRYLRAKPGDAVLDIGCGTAEILQYMPPVKYTGYDTSALYIDSCRERYPTQTFVNAPLPEGGSNEYDLVIALGVLHHMNDEECRSFFAAAKRNLKPGGRVVTFDNCRTKWQNPLTRLLFALDRGRGIRYEPGFRALAESEFRNVKSYVVTDMMPPWVPYTHIAMEATAEPLSAPQTAEAASLTTS